MPLPTRTGERNERFKIVIDLILMEALISDYTGLREACERVFESRAFGVPHRTGVHRRPGVCARVRRRCLPHVPANGTIPAVKRFLLIATILTVGAASALAQGSAPLSSGDRVFVRVGSDTTWSDSLAVDAEGKIFLPRIGALGLSSVPATAVPASVRQALASVYRLADATVVPLRRVTVSGEVRRPGVYFLPVESSIGDAVAIAQGATDIGNLERLTLVRGGTTTQLRHWITGPQGAQTVASGDLLVVERDAWLKRNALSLISTVALLITTIVAVTR
jgi:polysaccharide export outer membrane protein